MLLHLHKMIYTKFCMEINLCSVFYLCIHTYIYTYMRTHTFIYFIKRKSSIATPLLLQEHSAVLTSPTLSCYKDLRRRQNGVHAVETKPGQRLINLDLCQDSGTSCAPPTSQHNCSSQSRAGNPLIEKNSRTHNVLEVY